LSDKDTGADCLLKLRQASMCETSLAKGTQLSTTTKDSESYGRFEKDVECLPCVGLLKSLALSVTPALLPFKLFYSPPTQRVEMLHQLYNGLTIVQSASALTFSVFYITHATQFLAAPFGGIEASNKYLLLGRPLYQDEHLEPILVTGAASVHILSGLAKGAIRQYWKRNSTTDLTPRSTVYHRRAGYALIPLVALHYTVARDLPQKYFGDSTFLDYSYIAFLLQNYPAITYIGHTALISIASFHIAAGMNVAVKQLRGHKKQQQHQNDMQATSKPLVDPKRIPVYVSLVVSGLTLGGLYVLGRTEKIPLRREYARIIQRITSN
jgi:hypothetical protein